MKIAIVHPSLKIKGGAENVVIWLAEELSARGHIVDIITTDYDHDFWGHASSKDYGVIELPLGGYNLTPVKWIINGWTLRHVLVSYDVVNPHNFPAYIWVYFAKRFNPTIRKIVWFCEEPVRGFYRHIIDLHVIRVLEMDSMTASKKLPLAQRVKKRTLKQWASFGRSYIFNWYARKVQTPIAKQIDLFVVPRLDVILTNSTYIASTVKIIFGISATPCLLGIPDDRFVTQPAIEYKNFIFTPTRLFYEKNVFNCIRAVKLLVESGTFPCNNYIITGSGALIEDVRKFVADQGLSDIVLLKGFVSEVELSEYFATASLVMYLPLDETYGLVFPEAGFYRKAVLGPDHGGPIELVKDGLTGRIVDPLDPLAISQMIVEMFKDRQNLIKMGQENEKFSRSNLTFKAFVDRFLQGVE